MRDALRAGWLALGLLMLSEGRDGRGGDQAQSFYIVSPR